MCAQYVSSQLIKVIPRGGKMIAVEIVDKTTAWNRPENCPAPNVQLAFVKIVEKHVAFLNPATTKIAMMYVYRDLRSKCPCHNADRIEQRIRASK